MSKNAQLPKNDAPEAAPIPTPAMSPERAAAITKAIADGEARTVAHALFLANAGALVLPA